jgi:hypothetical protein
MEALQEVTDWGTAAATNNTYLLDGTNLVAYIPQGGKPYYFKNPIKGFDKRGRKFVKVDIGLFPNNHPLALFSIGINRVLNTRTVKGSKGETYTVNDDEGTCSCPGYTYRGTCKHIKELA